MYLITFYILLGIHKDRRRNVIRKNNSEEAWYKVRGNYLPSAENEESGYDDFYFFNTEKTVEIIEKIENDRDASFIYEVSY